MAITGVSSGTNTYASSSDKVESPKGTLDNDAFMKLFLAELKYQDPTAPMDSSTMLTQTSQLTQLETNEALKTALESVTSQLKESAAISTQFSSLGLVGKTVESGANTFSVTDVSKSSTVSLYFPTKIKEGNVKIYDEKDNVVKTFSLAEHVGKSGYIDFKWDIKDDNGVTKPKGTYKAKSEYTDADGEKQKVTLGNGKIEGILFDSGIPYARLGSIYVPIDKIKEVL